MAEGGNFRSESDGATQITYTCDAGGRRIREDRSSHRNPVQAVMSITM